MFNFILSLVNQNATFAVVVLGILAYIIALVVAIVGHELSHGFIAYKNGDLTAKFLGRLSLNPIKHFDLMGFGLMLLVGFGWAKPVPIDPRNFKNYKKGMIMTSLAGVTFNFLIAFISALLFAIFTKATQNLTFTEPNALYCFLMFISFLLQLSITFNLTLMAFNLLPVYPLDGFRVVETLTKPDNAYVNFMYKYGSYVMLALLLISFTLGRIVPQLDILSNYILWVQKIITWLFDKIFGLTFGAFGWL